MFSRVITTIKAHKILAIVAVLIIVVILFSFKKKNNAIKVDTYTVSKQEIVKTITASGTTTPKKDYVARAGVAAKIDTINYESGEQVQEGDVVLKLDQASLQAVASSAWKSYLDAKASQESLVDQIKAAETAVSTLRQARDTAWRAYMGDDGDSTKQAYKTAESNYQDAEAALAVLKDKKSAVSQGVTSTYSSYSVAAANLTNGIVKAPASGTLVLEDISNGSSVLAGQILFSITNFEGTEFTAEIDETDIQYIKEGQRVDIELEGYTGSSSHFVGTISRIDGKTQVTSSGSTIVPASIKFLSGPTVTLILDMSGTANIEVAKDSNSIAIPFEAITFDADDKSYVFIVKDGIVEKREVTLGFEGTNYVAVNDGLTEGDVIVVGDAVSRLSDGSKISTSEN